MHLLKPIIALKSIKNSVLKYKKACVTLRRPPKALVDFYKQYCDKKIKQYFDKAVFYCQNIAVAFQNLYKTQTFVFNCYPNNIFNSHGKKTCSM